MAKNILLLFIGTAWLVLGGVYADDEDELKLATELVNPGYHEKPEWFKQSFLDIREDIDEAAEEDRRVMLYFYQDGCPYCAKLLQDNFGQVDIADKTQQHFDTVAINMWGDREVVDLAGNDTTEKEFSKSLRVQFTPTMLLLDEAGNTVVRINGYYAPHKFAAVLDYVGTRQESAMSVREYVGQHTQEAASGVLHRDASHLPVPFALDAALATGEKPLLVLFEQKQCSVCDEWHSDIFKRPETRELLAQFDIALLDIWSDDTLKTTTGAARSQKQWAADLAVGYAPTMVFFEPGGQEVFRTEGYL
ncbi:MAG: thioredoxin fold domain-containing protein, partial [Pseudomonadota bacterium]